MKKQIFIKNKILKEKATMAILQETKCSFDMISKIDTTCSINYSSMKLDVHEASNGEIIYPTF